MPLFRPVLTLALPLLFAAGATATLPTTLQQGFEPVVLDSALLAQYNWRDIGPDRGGLRSRAGRRSARQRHDLRLGAVGPARETRRGHGPRRSAAPMLVQLREQGERFGQSRSHEGNGRTPIPVHGVSSARTRPAQAGSGRTGHEFSGRGETGADALLVAP